MRKQPIVPLEVAGPKQDHLMAYFRGENVITVRAAMERIASWTLGRHIRDLSLWAAGKTSSPAKK